MVVGGRPYFFLSFILWGFFSRPWPPQLQLGVRKRGYGDMTWGQRGHHNDPPPPEPSGGVRKRNAKLQKGSFAKYAPLALPGTNHPRRIKG